MRVNEPNTGRETPVSRDERLISTTNLKGVIQSANDAFCRVSGFGEDELVGKAHNIVRNPDMPEAVYRDFWETLEADSPWLGVVKNRCSNGDHYWVSAYVSPVYRNGEKVGYQSVRSAAGAEPVARAEQLYARMRRGGFAGLARLRPGLRAGSSLVAGAAALAGFLAGVAGGLAPAGLAMAAVVFISALLLSRLASARIAPVVARARAIFDNPVGEITYGGGNDEAGAIDLALEMQGARIDTLRTRIDEVTGKLASAGEDTSAAADLAGDAIGRQTTEIEQVATAMNEMAVTVQEVSRNSTDAAAAASEATGQADTGRRVVTRAADAMGRLTDEVEQVAATIRRVEGDTREIRHVLDVINGVAEQTNLLALNAAIEAARAGESGRGFAVVADEVRGLARRVAESTGEIATMIERLETGAGEAVTAMETSERSVREVSDYAREATEAINGIEASVERIRDMNDVIASAAEEQSATAEEINRNVQQVNDASRDSASAAQGSRAASTQLVSLVGELQSLLKQFSGAAVGSRH